MGEKAVGITGAHGLDDGLGLHETERSTLRTSNDKAARFTFTSVPSRRIAIVVFEESPSRSRHWMGS